MTPYAPDVILSTVPHSAISTVIRTATRSAFSHAAVYRGQMNVLKAIGVGITNYSIMRRGVRDKNHVRILRVAPSVESKVVAAALAAAEGYRGRGCWVSGALQSVIANKSPDSAGRMFCSYFVAQIFADAGLTLCPNVPSHDVTPGMLISSPHLQDKTDEVLVPIPGGFESAFEAIDCEQTSTPTHRLLQAERDIVAQAANKLLQAANLRAPRTLDDLFAILVTEVPAERQAELDAQLSAILEASKYKDIDSAWVQQIPTTVEFPIAPADMPNANLVATIGVHRETLRKWLARLNDYDEELEAGCQISEILPAPLRTVQLLQDRTRNRRQLLVNAIADIQRTIAELEQLYEERQTQR